MRMGDHLTLVQIDRRVSTEYRKHCDRWDGCQFCEIGKWTRPKVHYRGEMPCDMLTIGEAPGREEQASGFPFVGMSGKTFEAWCTWASKHWIGRIARPFPSIGITNTCACRPSDTERGPNRAPTNLEQENCSSKFGQLMLMARPKTIICLGAVARDYWLSRPYAEVQKLPALYLPHPSPLRVGGPNSGASRQAQEKLLNFAQQYFSAGYVPAR